MAQEPAAAAVGEVAEHGQDHGKRERGPGPGQHQGDHPDQAMPARLQAGHETARLVRCLVLGLRRGGDQEHVHGAERGLVGQGALAGEQGFQAGLLVVDLVLHGEQAADRARVAQQGAQLADRRLRGRHPAAHIGHGLRDVLGVLRHRQPRAELGGQRAERGLVGADRDLQLEVDRGPVRVGPVQLGVLAGHVPARGAGQLGGLGRRPGEVGGTDGQAGRVDDRRCGGQRGQGGAPRPG